MIIKQKEISNNLYWLNLNIEKLDLQVNFLSRRFHWLKLYKGPMIKVVYSWVGLDIDKVKISYFTLFLKYFFGVQFKYTHKFIGRDNKKMFYIVKGALIIKEDRVKHFLNLREELLVYLRKGLDYTIEDKVENVNRLVYLFKDLEIIFNKRLSNKFALFFPIMNTRFFLEIKLHKSISGLALKNV